MFDADYDCCGDNVKPAGPGDAICGACEFPCEKRRNRRVREWVDNKKFTFYWEKKREVEGKGMDIVW